MPVAVTDRAAPPHLALRAATHEKHEQVDAGFARFDLADPVSYGAMLTAHARVLPAIEAVLRARPDMPQVAPRTNALADDLARLGRPMPPAETVAAAATSAAAWGMLYVIEGSRLGGAMIARSVPEHLPKAYLSAAHARGGWKGLLGALDAAGEAGGEAWLADAIAAARRTFDLYERAADEQARKEGHAHG